MWVFLRGHRVTRSVPETFQINLWNNDWRHRLCESCFRVRIYFETRKTKAVRKASENSNKCWHVNSPITFLCHLLRQPGNERNLPPAKFQFLMVSSYTWCFLQMNLFRPSCCHVSYTVVQIIKSSFLGNLEVQRAIRSVSDADIKKRTFHTCCPAQSIGIMRRRVVSQLELIGQKIIRLANPEFDSVCFHKRLVPNRSLPG